MAKSASCVDKVSTTAFLTRVYCVYKVSKTLEIELACFFVIVYCNRVFGLTRFSATLGWEDICKDFSGKTD